MRRVDMHAAISHKFLPANAPERLFTEWMQANTHRLKEATEELGVTVQEGPEFYERWSAAVTNALRSRA